MRTPVIALAMVLLTPSAARACTTLPTPSAKRVPISVVKVNDETKRTALRVCGHELARGTMRERLGKGATGRRVAAASTAGHRVAWIEERRRGRDRRVVLTLARVGREVRVLRRLEVQRTRTIYAAVTDVLLTREGDLAWSADDGEANGGGFVKVEQRGKRARRVSTFEGTNLTLEDGRTLRWLEVDSTYGFLDLRPVGCDERSRFHPWASNARVQLSRALYGPHAQIGTTVVRGCDLATGRDRVLIQSVSDFSSTAYLDLIGLDRDWAVFHGSEMWHEGPGPSRLTVVNVRTGRATSASTEKVPAPLPGDPFAVTERGVTAYVTGGVLYGLVAPDRIVRLDAGVITDLRADGDTLRWTRDGVPMSSVPGAGLSAHDRRSLAR
ncbi:hypothetical protein OJ997_32100 [Solirubrobacter phytolaccae]|uniref:Uncharacterized protein n=1 Tax=Solirubrobacter phytolaccae TaxID=1404360 RepID=A0A9X3NK32_9ACTN|nr:hypothetical protein [Solirubrobacter phytolaccae]MDA0184991.1 hypothetical protein [Solirubrobacter phytolaccae]